LPAQVFYCCSAVEPVENQQLMYTVSFSWK